MLHAVLLIRRVMFFPVWILWRAYLGLWWAFDDASIVRIARDAKGSSVTPGSPGSPETPNSPQPPAPAGTPRQLLKAGFVGTLATSVAIGLAMLALGSVEPGTRWMAWILGTAATSVGTVLVVRHHHRRERRTLRAAAVASVKECAAGATRACRAAGRGVAKGAGEVARSEFVRRAPERVAGGVRSMWSRVRELARSARAPVPSKPRA